MSSLRTPAFVITGLLSLAAGCAEAHPMPDAAVASDAGPPGDAPRTCNVSPTNPDLVLEPASDNPDSCRTPAPCELWFGHGQHLRCPRYLGPPSPITVECDLGEYDEATGEYDRCLCDDGAGFVADFATGEVVHTREGTTCRYRIVFERE